MCTLHNDVIYLFCEKKRQKIPFYLQGLKAVPKSRKTIIIITAHVRLTHGTPADDPAYQRAETSTPMAPGHCLRRVLGFSHRVCLYHAPEEEPLITF